MKLAVVQILILKESLILVPEVVVVFKIFLGENLKEFRMGGVGIAKSLNCGEGGKVVEVEVGAGEESNLESA